MKPPSYGGGRLKELSHSQSLPKVYTAAEKVSKDPSIKGRTRQTVFPLINDLRNKFKSPPPGMRKSLQKTMGASWTHPQRAKKQLRKFDFVLGYAPRLPFSKRTRQGDGRAQTAGMLKLSRNPYKAYWEANQGTEYKSLLRELSTAKPFSVKNLSEKPWKTIDKIKGNDWRRFNNTQPNFYMLPNFRLNTAKENDRLWKVLPDSSILWDDINDKEFKKYNKKAFVNYH